MTFYTVYKTINTANDRFYIGVHKTSKPNDGYLGSGIALNEAIKKYGRANFKKEILFLFNTADEAYQKEFELVTKELIAEGICYNLTVGGVPSIDWPVGERKKTALHGDQHPQWGKTRTDEAKKSTSEKIKQMWINENDKMRAARAKAAASRVGKPSALKGRTQTDDANKKRSESHKALPKKICPHCQRELSPSNFQRHLITHSG